MTPAGFEHGRIVIKTGRLLSEHVEQRDLGLVSGGDIGVLLRRDPDTVRAPDVLYVSDRQARRSWDPQGYVPFPPDLAVEVIAPGDRWSDIEEKVAQYLEFGIRLVWVVDPKTKHVHVHQPDRNVQVLATGDTLNGGEVLPDFSCEVGAIFS